VPGAREIDDREPAEMQLGTTRWIPILPQIVGTPVSLALVRHARRPGWLAEENAANPAHARSSLEKDRRHSPGVGEH
jgi:hypothetical protein